jgi:hypothetical protein
MRDDIRQHGLPYLGAVGLRQVASHVQQQANTHCAS